MHKLVYLYSMSTLKATFVYLLISAVIHSAGDIRAAQCVKSAGLEMQVMFTANTGIRTFVAWWLVQDHVLWFTETTDLLEFSH